MSTIVYYYKEKKLTENQTNPALHFFVFDHFLFRWTPQSFRNWARFGMTNPNVPNTESSEDKDVKIDETVTVDESTLPVLDRFGMKNIDRKTLQSLNANERVTFSDGTDL